MKHTVTDLNDAHELVMFSNSILGNFFFDTYFGELDVEISPLMNSNMKSELLRCSQIVEPNYILVDSSSTNFYT